MASGRSRLSRKQALLVGLGSEFKSCTASSVFCGAALTPAGARHLARPSGFRAGLSAPPAAAAPPAFEPAEGSGSSAFPAPAGALQPHVSAVSHASASLNWGPVRRLMW